MNSNTISDHHFYDQDISLEGKGLLTDVQEEYLNEEPKKQQTGFLVAALLVLVVLAIATIGWVQFHQRYGRLYLCHAIMATLAFLFALYAVVYFLGVKSNLNQNKETSPAQSIIIYIGALLFAGYFIGSAAYLWVYRGYFANYTQATKAIPDRWGKHFWNHDYQKTQDENWRLVLTQVILGLVAGVLFGIVAWASFQFMKNSLQTKKITLMVALLTMAIFAALIIIYYMNDRKRWAYVKQYFENSGGMNLMLFFFWAAIVSLIIAFLNAAFNVVGSFQGSRIGKGYNLIFGFIWICFGVFTLIFCALLFKDIYMLSVKKPLTCNRAADIAHENEYVRGWSQFCNGKYLAAGQTCRKDDFYSKWEDKSL